MTTENDTYVELTEEPMIVRSANITEQWFGGSTITPTEALLSTVAPIETVEVQLVRHASE